VDGEGVGRVVDTITFIIGDINKYEFTLK